MYAGPAGRLPNFLAEHRLSLAVTTYQAGKPFLLGLRPDGRLSVFERMLEHSMGLVASAGTLHVATLQQFWKFAHVLPPGQDWHGHDALYAPRSGHRSRVVSCCSVPPCCNNGTAPRRYITSSRSFGAGPSLKDGR